MREEVEGERELQKVAATERFRFSGDQGSGSVLVFVRGGRNAMLRAAKLLQRFKNK